MHRQRMIAAALAGVVATSGAGWAAGSRMRSPAQVAADTAPPPPSVITAAVEERVLSSTVTTRGTVRFGEPQPVTLAASSLGAGPGGAGSALVTRAPEKGAELAESSVALEVAGRPVLVLQGAVPMYRDLKPGDTGTDVRQLEEALARLGFRPGAVDGRYDAATEGAVDAWYAAAGHQAQGPSDEQREALRNARSAVSSAEDRALQADDALAKARGAASARDLAMAEAEVRSSERDLERARADLAAAQADSSAAQEAEAQARSDGDASERRAAAEVAEAESDLAAAEAAGSPEAVADARRALDEARRSSAAAAAEAAAARRQAADQAAKAARAVPEATRAVAAAGDKLALARLGLEEVRTPPDTGTAEAAAAKARRDLAEARAQLEELDGEVGVVVPADEVLFFPSLPLRVDEPKVERGDDGSQEVMVVSTSRLAVDGSVSIPDARLVEVGDRVTVTSPELGQQVSGVVTRLADTPGTDGVDAQKVYLEVVPDDPPAELTGAAVRIDIAVESTGGAVTAVPVAALSVGSDGSSRVQVLDAGGTLRTVVVEPGLAAQGFVEVKPAGGARLEAGDRVVVGSGGRRRA